jgi:phytoene dehydrogenase-like protein
MAMGVDVHAAVVGAGHNGLAAAWYLARAGLRVHVFERRSFVGGAAVTQELWPGYFFSTCAHALHGLHPKIIRDMRLYERGLEVIKRGPGVPLLPDERYWGPAEIQSPRNLTANLTA